MNRNISDAFDRSLANEFSKISNVKKISHFNFGNNLRRIRDDAHMTAQQLAKKSRVSTSTISSLERGLTYPTLKNLCSIVNVLGQPIGEFFK